MTAAVNQDFVTFAGDTAKPVFVVQTSAGVAVDISGASEIAWSAGRNLADGAVITKTKTGGGIAFTNTGVDGKFTLTLSSTDTTLLSDWYMHWAKVTDSSGNITTCTVGRMQVAQTPNWTWVPSLVGVEKLYTVRRLIGDVRQSDQLLTDQEIKWAVGKYSNEWLAASECCRNIAAGFSVQVDVVQGELKTNYSARARAFMRLALDLEQRGHTRGGVTAYVGGISLSDKSLQQQDTDAVQPQFVLGQWDNLLPESPVGHQVGAGQGGGPVDADGLAP